MALSAPVYQQLQRLKPELVRRYHVRSIALFGSHARGEAGEESDVDLLVEMEPVTYDNLFELKTFLEEQLEKKTDVVLRHKHMNKRFRALVEAEALDVR